MKLLLKAISFITFILTCSYSYAAITYYENTDTDSLVYGSYKFDDVYKIFSEVDLKGNFTRLGGPTDISLDVSAQYIEVVTAGSRNDTLYRFQSFFTLDSGIPSVVTVLQLVRFESLMQGGIIDYINAFGELEPIVSVTFRGLPENISAVPEPEILSLLALCPFLFLARRREQQK